MDADFLAIYRIDLETTVVGARRFLSLAARTPAYDGAMKVALTNQQQSAAAPATDPDAPQEVSVDAMNLMMPGLIERVEV